VPGIPSAAARGYDEARGDVIARLDADSRPDPDWLRRIRRTLERRPDAIAVTGRGRFHDLGPVASALAQLFYMQAYFALCGGGLAGRPVFGSNFAMRADVWRRVSGEVHRDVDVHDDLDLSFHFEPGEAVVYDRELVVDISGRPFRDPRSMLTRVRRAWTTFAVHGWGESPVPRWRRRLLARRGAG
jgi:cellulose synthase/poly-beta-1,6-N-acetylglucosamine synthase-like glycosyltransferase